MVRINKGIVLSILVISTILLSSTGLSQTVMNLSGLARYKWYIVLSGIAAGSLIVAGLFLVRRGSKYGALVTKLGFFMIAVTIFVAEIAIIFGSPYFKKYRGDYYTACGKQKPEYWIDKLACYTVGYVGKETAPGGKTVFAVSLLVYFALLWSIMYDLANSIDMPSNVNARRVFSFALAYIALRGWLITYFVQFVEYGAIGLSAFYITVFFIGAVWSLLNKRLAGWFIGNEIENLYKRIAELEQRGYTPQEALNILVNMTQKSIMNMWNEPYFKKLIYAAESILPGIKAQYEGINGNPNWKLNTKAQKFYEALHKMIEARK